MIMRPLQILALLACLPAAGQAGELCGPRYAIRRSLDLPAALTAPQPGVANFWGRQNLTILQRETGAAEAILRVRYPAGSINPGNRNAPAGGAGFLLPLSSGAEARCLHYRLRFPADFDFARGGKLPGLAGGEVPRGCTPAELAAGFSARLMWRTNGEGEIYLYAPDRSTRCGESLGRGGWRFPRGTWVGVAQEVVLNAPDRSDGMIRLWIDGRLMAERHGLMLRQKADTRIDALLFATFFGGSDASWASPKDQAAEFAGFELWEAAAP